MAAIQDWVKQATELDDSHVLWSLYGAPRPGAPWVELNVQEERNPAHDWVRSSLNVLHVPDQTVTSVDVGANALAIPAHPFVTGDGPVRVTAGTFPGGLLPDTDYWVVVVDAGNVQLADTFQKTGGNYPGNPITPVDLTSAGVGPIKLIEQPTTVRAGRELVRTANGQREVHIEMQVFGPLKSGILAFSLASDIVASLPLHVYDLDQAGVGVSDLGSTSVQGSVRATPGNRGELVEPRATVDLVVYVAASLSAFSTFIQTAQMTMQPVTQDGQLAQSFSIEVES